MQPRKTFEKRVPLIPRTRANCSRWLEGIQNRLIAEIGADLPRFSEGINSPCFSHYGRFGRIRHKHPHRHDSFQAPSASSKAGWSWGWVSAVDCEGRTIWIADAHRDGKRFLVHDDKKLTAFLGFGKGDFCLQSGSKISHRRP